MLKKYFYVFILSLLIYPTYSDGKAKIAITHSKTAEGFPQIQVTNETNTQLTCYVAINGHKIRFNLAPRASSQWFKATHKQFNYRHFSTWCDDLALHSSKNR